MGSSALQINREGTVELDVNVFGVATWGDMVGHHGVQVSKNSGIRTDNPFGSTDIALKIQSAGIAVHQLGPASLGFYGASPVAQQTGVAVTAAAIHAALVNLGLITA